LQHSPPAHVARFNLDMRWLQVAAIFTPIKEQ
jgi:hypothetical protein